MNVRDNEKEDGDIISISLNGEWIAQGLKVTNSGVEIVLNLQRGIPVQLLLTLGRRSR